MTDRIALQQFRTAAATSEREHAFADIVRRHAAWLYNAALRQVNDPAAAEEATQATFIVLARKAGKLRDDTSLSSWLAAVLRLAVLRVKRDHARRRKHETQAAMNQAKESSAADPSTAQNPAAAAEWRELAPMLDEAVASLSHTDREAILLRFYRQLTYVEIGDALHLSEDAARKRVDRAVEKLRGTLNRRGVLTGVGAVALATLLWSHSTAVAAPAGLIGVSSSLALSTSATATAVQATATAKGVSIMLAATKLKLIGVAFLLLLVVGLASEKIARRSFAQSSPVGQMPVSPKAVENVPVPMDASPLVAKLKNGITVELVGVSTALRTGQNAEQRLWWRPNGARAAVSDTGGGRVWVGKAIGTIPLEFRLKATFANGAGSPSFSPSVYGAINVGIGMSTGFGGLDATVAANVPDRPATVRLSIAAGPWNDELTTRFPSATPGDLPAPVTVIDKRYRDSYRSEVSFSRDRGPEKSGKIETRLVALDANGKQYVAGSSSFTDDAATPGNDWLTFRFEGVDPADIRELRFQTRPLDQWVEFRNIAVHEGQSITPEVATSDDPVRATFADGVTTELVAIGEPATGQWWTPDGRMIAKPTWPREEAIQAIARGQAIPGTRVLSFITQSGASGEVASRSMAVSFPTTAGDGTMFAASQGLYREMTQIRLPADVQTVTLRTQVGVKPQTVTLRPDHDRGWTADAAVSLTSPGGTVYTLGHPQQVGNRAFFNAHPWPHTPEVLDSLDFTLLRRGGDAPAAYQPIDEKAAPMSLNVVTNEHTLPDITGVTMKLTRYDHQADFTGVALRPGVATTVGVVMTEPANSLQR